MVETRKPRTHSPIIVAVGLMLLAIPGFALGLLAGVVWEEPGLLFSHVLGRTTEVVWSRPAAEGADELPDVAAPAPGVTRMRPEVLSPDGREAVPGGVAASPATAATPASANQRTLPPTRPTGARFAVQVGAFTESATAERLAKRLQASGFSAYVSPGVSAGSARWRVRVGPHRTREQADDTAARLKAQEKLPTWVLDENGPAA